MWQQAGSVDNAPASFEIQDVGLPLFLHYKPKKLMRGQPAAVISWAAYDQYGRSSGVFEISIGISCDPGYAMSEEDTSTCVPCQPGYYNLPDFLDQVRAACPALSYASKCGTSPTLV